MKRLFVFYVFLFCLLTAWGQNRVKASFDFDWKFSLTDSLSYSENDFDDRNWTDIQLPHDWSIKLNFDMSISGSAAHLPGGIGWYRKTFDVPLSYRNKSVSILFDGIFHQSDVYINGKHLGFRPYGFCSIEYDLTPYLIFGKKNVISVRVNRSGKNDIARWYTGSGIYRHAWLIVADPVHVVNDGTYITTPKVNEAESEVKISTTLTNASDVARTISVVQRILSQDGKQIGKMDRQKVTVQSGDTVDVTQWLTVTEPLLWSVNTPSLYTMETSLVSGGKVLDTYTTTFGIRTVEFTSDRGFFLNGKPLKLKGLCLHQDAGALGTAVPDRSDERRLEILKEYGCNAIRCAHNQFSPGFLDLCDRMGFLVIDEAFDKWKSGYYEKYFDEWWQRDLGNMLVRDRNHPSVMLWSIGNELQEAWDGSDTGWKRAKMLQDFVHEKEPSRMVILSAQNKHNEKFSGVTDVIGYNYLEARMLSDHEKFPERRFVITEELPYYSGEEGNIRSYTPYNPWNIIADNDFVAGGFIWSGVDYLGEAVGDSHGWPNGLFDICMFEKPRAAYHRAMWNDKPLVSIAFWDPSLDIDHGRDLWQWPKMASHWNLPKSYIGQVIQVCTITNCDEFELFLNGNSMGRQKTSDFSNNTIIWNIPYKPGVIEAKGFKKGEHLSTYKLETSKNTNHLVLTPDRKILKADGQDLSHISVQLYDEDGKPVQTDDKMLEVSVEGDGKFLGIDNGDLRRKGSFAGNTLKTYFGKALIVVQSLRQKGTMTVKVKMEGADIPYTIELSAE
ncbi:sugar-binding domain-containing protein [uncultured Bacteroides sp.]|uniref:sugar-binding domain-containing protein n=1 Tax=uncultured Bacteroides sp. TaxID=162156 RepID=UPI00261AD88F|nr:sugar-binding domain-containing protein [uncultured Bacteroides sp.]